MAKLSKIEQARFDGFNRACEIARKDGAEALLEEQKRRGISRISVAIPERDFQEQMNEWKSNCLQTVLLMGSAVLRDEFDFGRERLIRFVHRFNEKSDCIGNDYLTWTDLALQMAKETGIDYKLPYFEETEGNKNG